MAILPLKLKVGNFWVRTFSTLVLVPICLSVVWTGYPFNLLLAGITAAWVFYEWFRISRYHIGWLIGGFFYLGLGIIGLTVYLVYYPANLFLGILITTWVTDTSAYIIGRSLKGPKLAPSISPNKTWSGALGGFFLGTLIGSLVFHLLPNSSSYLKLFKEFHPITVAAIASFVIIAQVGDLIESWAKRRLGIKDSGNLIPGHGGLLDRLDSLIAIGIFLFFLEICSPHSVIVNNIHTYFG